MMIGSGTPRSHNKAPRPNPMSASFFKLWRNNEMARRRFQRLHVLGLAALALAVLALPAPAQDVRGLEICTAEKQMERRTSCLQSNVEFLQQALGKTTRETRERLAAAGRDMTAAEAEIAALKTALGKIQAELAEMKKKPESKSDKK
jgi:septal ring factor EnvC (AmiA/AmiB activator)